MRTNCQNYTAKICRQYSHWQCYISRCNFVVIIISNSYTYDTEEHSLRSIAVLGSNMHYQITVGNVTLPKAALSAVKIFAVYIFTSFRPQKAFLESIHFRSCMKSGLVVPNCLWLHIPRYAYQIKEIYSYGEI